MKFSELNLDAMQADLDKKHAEFMADMEKIRLATNAKLDAASKQLDAMLTELKQFDKETNNAFNKKV